MKRLGFVFAFVFSIALFAQAQSPESRWAEFENNKVHYFDIGRQKDDKALVFIHGWTGNTDVWNASYSAFPGTRVVVVDLIGHGRSDKPRVAYTMDYFARSVDAVLKKAKVKKAVFVGHSMGTPIARQMYRLYPAKTAGIVIVDGGLRPFTKEQSEQFLAPMRKDYRTQSVNMIDGMTSTIKDERLKQLIRNSTLGTPEHVGISAMEGFNEDKLWLTDPINVPVLAILAKGPFWQPDNEKFFRSVAPRLNYQMWDGVSHFLMMEKPAEFNQQIRYFLISNKLLRAALTGSTGR